MRLRIGSDAWHGQLDIQLKRLRDMIDGRVIRSRRESDMALKQISTTLSRIKGLKVTYSAIQYDPLIAYRNDCNHKPGIYDEAGSLIYLSWRGEAYWKAAAATLRWYNITWRRRVRKGTIAEDKGAIA